MNDKEYGKQIVETLYRQIGAATRMATAARDFVADYTNLLLMFRVTTSKRGYFKVIVKYAEAWDDYTVTFGQVKGADWVVINEVHNVYCDQLETLVYDMANGVYSPEGPAPKTETITDRHGNSVQSLLYSVV